MGVCLPKQNNKYIISIYEKQSLGKTDLSRFSTNFTALKTIKSIKNLSNSCNRLSKVTRYDDINKYYILSKEIINEGGSGIIYGGKNKNSNSKEYEYAIKQVIKHNDQLNISLKKEIEINSIIHHNNIVQCFDIFEDDLSIYFVFEFMPDGDLFDYIIKKPNHRLNNKEIVNILEQILLALIYLHEKLKIVHRDIKPENFMIKKRKNDDIIVKLMDFGTSDFIREEGFNYFAQGTPLYIAPEIYLDQEYDSKIDMWALGVVLYNMTTGSHPFKSNKKNDNLENNKKNNIELDLSSIDEDKIIMNNVLTKELDFNIFQNYGLRLLAQHLLEPNPKERYSAIEAFNELKIIKKNIILNKRISKTINESPKKIAKSPIIFEGSNEKFKYSVKSSFNSKFKRIFKNTKLNDFNKSDDEEENSDDNSNEKKRSNNIKKDNEIRILIKKKNK